MGLHSHRPMALAPVVVVVVVVVVALVQLAISSSAELLRLRQPIKSDGSLSLLVVGDWGRRGSYNQSYVATAMGKIAEKLDIDFVISTGDNFYDNGLSGVDDKQFEESFTKIYTAKSLQKRWYSILGNHDYQGDVLSQLSPVLRKIDSRWFCMRSFIVNAEIVDFFFLDTNPFVKKYWANRKQHRYDWRGIAPCKRYISNLLKDLDVALKESTAQWKFVIGHHTMRSVSQHGDQPEMLQYLLPVLKNNSVDLYMNGHDHCLEHISSRDSPLEYFTSGAGSKAWRGVYRPNADNLRFFYDGQGFMSIQVRRSHAEIAFYNIAARRLYKWSMTKQLHPFI